MAIDLSSRHDTVGVFSQANLMRGSTRQLRFPNAIRHSKYTAMLRGVYPVVVASLCENCYSASMSWLSLRISVAAAVVVLSAVVFIRRHSEKVRLKKRLVDGLPAGHVEAQDKRASLFPGSQGNPGAPFWKAVKEPSIKVHDSRIERDERERGHADLAALLGAVVVILLTLTLQPGA
jgi:hypothetical protein